MKKYLLLLNYVDKTISTSYKGIFRAGLFRNNPITEQDLDKWKFWLEAANQSDEQGFFEEKSDAIKIAKEFKTLGEDFDVVECINVSEQDVKLKYQNEQTVFLGYDVCDTQLHSLIFWRGYDRFPNLAVKFEECNILEYLSLHYHASKLNENKLFDAHKDAQIFLKTEEFMNASNSSLNQLHISKENPIFIYKLYQIII